MIEAPESKLKEREVGLAVAYNQVFHRDNQFLQTVLEDLATFCRAHVSTFHPDARVHALQEGRREVWLRIDEYLNLSPEELFKLHTIRSRGRK